MTSKLALFALQGGLLASGCGASHEIVPLEHYTGPVGVYVIALQSNAVGGALAVDLPNMFTGFADSYPAVQQAYQLNCPTDGGSGSCEQVRGWDALAPRPGLGHFGVELSAGRRLDERFANVAIVKTATNGTSLSKQWEPDSPAPGTWQWDYMVDYLDDRLAELPEGSHVAGVMLIGFEGDAHQRNIAEAAGDELATWVARFRLVYGNVPVVVADLSAPGLPFTDTVSDELHVAAATIPDLALAKTSDLAFRDGVQHYDARSFITLGQRMAELFPSDGGLR